MDDARWIPAGYKRTEVGVIPEDWEVKRLGEIASIFSGGTLNFDSFILRGRYSLDYFQ